jgi:hypothetical protein
MNSMQRACDTRCRRSLQRCGSCSMPPSNFKYRGVECCPLPHAAAQVAHMRAQTAAGTVRARRALRQVEQPTLAAQESHMSLMLLFLTRQILRAGSPIKFDVRDCQWHWTPSLRAVPLVDMFHFATHCCKRLASKAGSGGQGASALVVREQFHEISQMILTSSIVEAALDTRTSRPRVHRQLCFRRRCHVERQAHRWLARMQ